MIIPLNSSIAGDIDDTIDLSIHIVGYTPINPTEGDSIDINLQITYQGITSVENLNVQLSCDTSDNIVNSTNISLLIPETSTNITMIWETVPGNHTLIALVDPQNTLQEIDKTNNIDQCNIHINESQEEPSPEVISITYGDNVKYEQLSTGVIRETIPSPTVYDKENKEWIPANLNLSWDEGNSLWHPQKSRANISLKNTVDSSGIFRFEMNGSWIEYLLHEGKMIWNNPNDNTEVIISQVLDSTITTHTNTLTYHTIFHNVDLSYTILPFGMKECFILNAPPPAADLPETTVLAFQGNIHYDHNLTIWADGTECTNKSFQTNNIIEFRKIGEPGPVFWLSPPFAYDSNMENSSYTSCFYDVTLNNGTAAFSVEISSTWLLSPERVYPVFIDPTIVTKYPVGDSFVRSYRPSDIYGSSTEFTVNPRTADICRSYLKFDLSSIPADSTIASATLRYYYYRYWEADPVGRMNDIHKVTASWNEGTLCWNNKPAYNPTAVISYIVPSSYGWIATDIQQYVQDKVNGETDYGLLVKDHTEQSMSLNTNPCMYSKEYGSYSPELIITYKPAGNYNAWREGESWERSCSTPTGGSWDILTDGTASNSTFTKQLSDTFSGDWAEWDFTVLSHGTYYFWVRAKHYSSASTSVRLLWSGNQIGSTQNWQQGTAEWKWTCFGSRVLYTGSGTLRITNPSSSNWMWIDNLLITNNVNYIPDGKGVEGSTDHTIGVTAYAENFENDLGREWSFYVSEPDYQENERSTYSAHTGSYSWRMDVNTDNIYSLNEMILHVKMSSASYLSLTFYTKEYGDEQHLMPSSFMGHSDADGIAVSNDRSNWVRLWQYPSSIPYWTEYGPLQIPDIGSVISISGDVYIKFQQYDNYQIPADGILWDDIYLESDGILNIDPEFILPAWGGAMVHSDPHLTDFINMPVPVSLGDEWSTYRSSTDHGRNERMEILEQIPSNGDNCWRMDVKDSGYYNLNEIIVHVKMNSGASYLNLDFWTKEYFDDLDLMPSSFTGHSNADGIAVSTDNYNWVRLWQYLSSVPIWAEYGPINIGNYVSLSGDVYIKFQQYGEYPILGIPSDGIVWDDVGLITDGTMTYGSGRITNSYLEDFNMTAWIRKDLNSEKSQNWGNGIAGNGEIVACPFLYPGGENNLIVYDYNGNRVWKSEDLLHWSTTSSTPMVSIDNKVIICDSYKIIMVDPYYNEDGECLWSTEIPGSPGVIFSPAITENGVIILPIRNGNIYVFNSDNGDFLSGYSLEDGYTVMSTDVFSTSNSACVNGNRVYILGEKSNEKSRLFAIDIEKSGNIFTPIWYYPYTGKSQASPTFINNVIYFDIYQSIWTPTIDVGACAVNDLGDTCSEKWNVSLSHMTWFTMTADPRGDSIWFEDTYHRNLTRLSLNNGDIMENISIEKLMGSGYRPISVMQICDETNPKMIVSANYPLIACYVICIDLVHQNSLIWMNRVISQWNCDYAGGQYTILLDNARNNPRIIFGAYWGGVYAFGH